MSKRSQTWFSFFNDRYAAALPTIAPFFFESETAGKQLQLTIFVLIMAAWVVCGCILTRKPRKKPSDERLERYRLNAEKGSTTAKANAP